MTDRSLQVVDNRELLSSLSTEELRTELSRAITLSARSIAYLAAVWMELERRGEDMAALRSGLSPWLPMVASGHLDAAAVVRFAGHSLLLRAISMLPLDRQRAIAEGELINVVEPAPGGGHTSTPLPAQALTAALVRQVFDGYRIRSMAEQERYLSQAFVRRRPVSPAGEALIQVKMDKGSAQSLRDRAAKDGVSVSALVRHALRAQGLIE